MPDRISEGFRPLASALGPKCQTSMSGPHVSFWHFKNVGAKNPSAGVLTGKACGAQLADGGEQTHSGR